MHVAISRHRLQVAAGCKHQGGYISPLARVNVAGARVVAPSGASKTEDLRGIYPPDPAYEYRDLICQGPRWLLAGSPSLEKPPPHLVGWVR